MSKKFDLEETTYGFRWGPMYVSRAFSAPKYGVAIRVGTAAWGDEGKSVYIRVTPGGRKIEVREA